MTNLIIIACWILAFFLVVYGLPFALQVLVSPLLGWIAARTLKEWETSIDR
ncbi:MAG: hypothetical protein ACE37E_01290 [Hyphomicrobiales bacterium]